MCCLQLLTTCLIPRVDNAIVILVVENLCATLLERSTYMRDINGPSSLGVKSGVIKLSDEGLIHREVFVLRHLDKSFGPSYVLKDVNFAVKL